MRNERRLVVWNIMTEGEPATRSGQKGRHGLDHTGSS